MSAVRWWFARWDAEGSVLPVVAVRVLLGLAVLVDLLSTFWVGGASVWWPAEAGGLSITPAWVSPEVALALALLGAVGWTLGCCTRTAALVCLFAHVQLAMLYPYGDRAIDQIVRLAWMILLFSRCGDACSVDAWWRTRSWRGENGPVPLWPQYLLQIQLLVIYTFAGVQKTALSWTPFGGFTALHQILQDPHVARFEPGPWLDTISPLLRIGTAVSWTFEWCAPLMVLWWFGLDRDWRLIRRLRPDRLWIAAGLSLHLGIAATMNLGIFPWAMLALYPCFWRNRGR